MGKEGAMLSLSASNTNLPERCQISKFNNAAGYRINIKSGVLLNMSNDSIRKKGRLPLFMDCKNQCYQNVHIKLTLGTSMCYSGVSGLRPSLSCLESSFILRHPGRRRRWLRKKDCRLWGTQGVFCLLSCGPLVSESEDGKSIINQSTLSLPLLQFLFPPLSFPFSFLFTEDPFLK